MATVDITSGATSGHETRRGKHVPYVVRRRFTAAAAVAAKGSALATGDVIQTIDIPANTLVMGAFLEVITADGGTAAPADLGHGGDPNQWVAAAALTTAGVKPVVPGTHQNWVFGTADTIDMVLGTLTAAGDDWVVEITAVLADVSAYPVAASAKENFA